jgi:hypothetical protein
MLSFGVQAIGQSRLQFKYPYWRSLFDMFVGNACVLTNNAQWTREVGPGAGMDGLEEAAVYFLDKLLYLYGVGLDGTYIGQSMYDIACNTLSQ